jgi:hypothetical protein
MISTLEMRSLWRGRDDAENGDAGVQPLKGRLVLKTRGIAEEAAEKVFLQARDLGG